MPDKLFLDIKVVSANDWAYFLSLNRNKTINKHPRDSSSGLQNSHLAISAPFIIDYFASGLKYLINKCCSDKLMFLSGHNWTHEFYFIVDSIGRTIHEERMYFTVVDKYLNEMINEVNNLLAWCRSNPTEVIKIFDIHETQEQIIHSIDNADFLLRLSKDNFNSSYWHKSSKLLFCFLFTIKKLLASSQETDSLFLYQIIIDFDL